MNKIIVFCISFIFVFNQIFLFNSFDSKIGLIFIPMFYYFFRNNFELVKFYTFVTFILMGVFQNSTLLFPIITMFLAIDFLTTLGKNFNLRTLEYFLIGIFILIYYFWFLNLFSFSFALTLVVYLGLILIRFIRRNGYFRFN